MGMKKSSILVLFIIFSFICVACDSKDTVVTSSGDKIDTASMEHKHCTRNSQQSDGISTDLSYEIYYTGDILNVLESNEKVVSDDSSKLDEYESAYKNIDKHYKDLEYYDTEVIRSDNYVLRHTTINYDKIDIDELISIEGEEDNIFENKEPKVQLWLDLAKKFGTKCKKVTE